MQDSKVQMKTKLLILFAFLMVWGIAAFGMEQERFSMIRVDLPADHRSAINTLQRMGIDITYFSGKEAFVEAIVNRDQYDEITKFGLRTTFVINDLAKHAERLSNENYFKPFHTYFEMLQEMQQIVAEHPNLASLHDIGDSYNKVQGRGGYDIWALKISDHVSVEDSSEADALFMANIHAREVITPEIIMYFTHYLIDRYGSDPYVTHLVDNREIWFIPTINPDGHEYVFTGDITAAPPFWLTDDPIWWRKNFADNNYNGLFSPNIDGVDLNRNFGYEWGYNDSGSSGNPGNDDYRGLEAFSEPETQAIRDFARQHHFIVSLSYHSYGRLWLYPWGYIPADPPEPDASSFKALGDSCAAYNGYEAGNYLSGTIYQTNGDTDDWLYGELGIFAFSPEVGSISQGRFWPDTTLILPLVLENLGPNLYMAYAAGEEPIVQHQRLPDVKDPVTPATLMATITPPVLLTESVLLDLSSCAVFYGTSKTASFDSVQLMPSRIQNAYAAQIPTAIYSGTLYYYVRAKDQIGRTGTSPRGAPAALDSFKISYSNTVAQKRDGTTPDRFELSQNYPNPFNSSTRFGFDLPQSSHVRLEIYNQLGQKVRTLAEGYLPAGTYRMDWDGANDAGVSVVSGLYICRLEGNGSQTIRKMLYLK
jgi:hypothetical protein